MASAIFPYLASSCASVNGAKRLFFVGSAWEDFTRTRAKHKTHRAVVKFFIWIRYYILVELSIVIGTFYTNFLMSGKWLHFGGVVKLFPMINVTFPAMKQHTFSLKQMRLMPIFAM
jgi:hypothetical protein